MVLRLPLTFSEDYRPATPHEIRSWSFGQLRFPRQSGAISWKAQRGTLADQGIFGPLKYQECACGRYKGKSYRDMICDICGTKVTVPAVRRERFAHLELPVSVPHPFVVHGEPISAVSVLPAAFVE